MYQDFKELLTILNDSKVKYLVVGGYAVSFHAQPRATKDLDILFKPDAGNAAAVWESGETLSPGMGREKSDRVPVDE